MGRARNQSSSEYSSRGRTVIDQTLPSISTSGRCQYCTEVYLPADEGVSNPVFTLRPVRNNGSLDDRRYSIHPTSTASRRIVMLPNMTVTFSLSRQDTVNSPAHRSRGHEASRARSGAAHSGVPGRRGVGKLSIKVHHDTRASRQRLTSAADSLESYEIDVPLQDGVASLVVTTGEDGTRRPQRIRLCIDCSHLEETYGLARPRSMNSDLTLGGRWYSIESVIE